MKINSSKMALLIVGMIMVLAPAGWASDESEVRGTIERVFQHLKSRDYNSLYDVLPASSRARISRARFTGALSRAQNLYALDRIDVGQVRVSGNIAVVDTVLYGRVLSPLEAEGKIVVQQFLVREDGNWRVATGDTGAIKRFLAGNPAFGRKFPIRQPRLYVKQNGNWIEFNAPRLPRS